MRYDIRIINSIRKILNTFDFLHICRNNSKDFTRNRKISAKSIIYYELNKRGLSSKMEINNFTELLGMTEVTSVAMLKQREKLNPVAFKYLNTSSLQIFYQDYKKEVQCFKGYVLTAVDGSDIEIPNSKKTRKEYNSYTSSLNNEISARATISTQYDLLNKFVLDVEIQPYRTSEIAMMKKNLSAAKEIIKDFDILRIMDRGYVSLEDMYNSNVNGDKYLVRLRDTDFKQERSQFRTNDFEMEIGYKDNRGKYYKKSNPALCKYLKDGGTIKTRIIYIELETGETEILATNIFDSEITVKDFEYMYNCRWGIETNYHYLKESMKIENISSSKQILINQDILSQMLVFNILQSISNNLEKDIEQRRYKNKMKININMAVGHIKNRMIFILLEDDNKIRDKLMEELDNKILKNIVPIRPGRKYLRRKGLKNKYHINKRKTF